LARFFEKHGSEGLEKSMVELAREVSAKKLVESVTENADMILAQILEELVAEDDYYAVSEIRKRLSTALGEETPPRWLDSRWVGRSLKRLGFDEKRRLGTGAQYRITPKKVKLTLIRLGIKNDLTTETKQTTETSQTVEKTPVVAKLPDSSTELTPFEETVIRILRGAGGECGILLFKAKIEATGFDWEEAKRRLQEMKGKVVQTKQTIALASGWRRET